MSSTATTHEKMQTDYLWMRDHTQADSWAQARTHGYNYLYYHVPNKRERLEMIYRSMGKQYDWELEKFRLSKKYPDRGNKRRWWKNLFRVVKHPLGYLFWKTYKFRTAKGRIITTAMGIGFTLMIIRYKRYSFQVAKKNQYVLLSGKNIEGSGQTNQGYYDQFMLKQTMPLTQFLYYEIPGSKIVVNPCRDQNYRKYFELRKKYGLKPPSIATDF